MLFLSNIVIIFMLLKLFQAKQNTMIKKISNKKAVILIKNNNT